MEICCGGCGEGVGSESAGSGAGIPVSSMIKLRVLLYVRMWSKRRNRVG